MRKRGISHLELVTAILIFLFAVGVAIYFINIRIKIETPEPLLDALEAKLREKAEIDFNKTSVFIDSTGDCFNISLHSDLQQEDLTFITDGANVAFNFSDEWLLINNTGQNLYKIYSFPADVTEDLRLGVQTCTDLTEGQDYNYSITYHGKIFTEKNLLDLKEMYDKQYRKLREDLGIGDRDFAINVENIVEMTKLIPEQVEVQVREFPIEVILEDGTIIEAKANIQVW